VRNALMGGFADSRILALHGKRMIERDFAPGGRARVQLKDQDTILAAAAAAKLHLPLSECVTGLYRDLVAHGGAELDQNALLLELERVNAPARLETPADRALSRG
jgi:2-hydroxy-3-oxopropionate reductase